MKIKTILASAMIAAGLIASGQAAAQEKLTVWWVKGFYKAEDDALFEAIKKYEAKNPGVKIDLSQYPVQDMIPKTVAALDSGSPPDVAYADVYDFQVAGKWAYEGKLEDISSVITPMRAQFAPNTGLIPDWIASPLNGPRPSNPFEIDGNANEGDYFWNACRIPWRLATDYVTSGDQRAKTVASKMTSFFQRSSGGDPLKVYPAYKLDGTALDTRYNSQSFSSPITSGAMVDGSFQNFLNNMFAWNVSHPAGGYFDNELQLIPMIVTTGNWWQP